MHLPYTYISLSKSVILLKWTLCIRIAHHSMQWTAFPFMNFLVGVGQKLKLRSLSMHSAVLTQCFRLIYRSQASFCLRSSFLRSRKRLDPSCRGSRQSPAVLPNSNILEWCFHSALTVSFHSALEPVFVYLLFWFTFSCYLIKNKSVCKACGIVCYFFITHSKVWRHICKFTFNAHSIK